MIGLRYGQLRAVFLERGHDRGMQFRQHGLVALKQAPARLRAPPNRLAERQGRIAMLLFQEVARF